MAATIRAFTIFRDEAEAPVAENKDVYHETTTIAVPTSGPLLVYAPDKENVDPTSGSRALSEHLLGKKRKTTLAAKAQPASPTKKPRPLAEKPTKKPSSKARSAEKKSRRSGSSKRSTSSRTRREPSLPRLTEEGEDHEVLDQVLIDAKCKELTVLPLADISEAYEQAPSPTDIIEAAVQAAEDKVCVALLWLWVTAKRLLVRPLWLLSRRTRSRGLLRLRPLQKTLSHPLPFPAASSLRRNARRSTPRSRSRRRRQQASVSLRFGFPVSSASRTSSRNHHRRVSRTYLFMKYGHPHNLAHPIIRFLKLSPTSLSRATHVYCPVTIATAHVSRASSFLSWFLRGHYQLTTTLTCAMSHRRHCHVGRHMV